MWKIKLDDCIGCSACTNVCPEEILSMTEIDGETKATIGKNQDKCTSCKSCEDTCPVDAIKIVTE